MTEEAVPASPFKRALQASLIATQAAALVLLNAALTAAVFDALPPYLDVLLVIFVLPFLLLIGALLFGVKVITPIFPSWLDKPNGREVELPALLAGAILAASLAAIYPGMFVGKDYANLALRGASYDVQPEEARPSSAYYGFGDATLRTEFSGSRARKVIWSDGNISRTKMVPIHAVPITGPGWTADQPVVVWALSEEELPPWLDRLPRFLEGPRVSDIRSDALRAVRSVAKEHELEVVRKPVLMEFGESYEELLQESRRKTWIVLGPLCGLVFAGVWLKTWSDLKPEVA